MGDISQDGKLIAAILANPVMIKAYLAGVPRNGKPLPDDAKSGFGCHTMVKTRDYVFTDYGAQVKRYEQLGIASPDLRFDGRDLSSGVLIGCEFR